MQVAGHTPRSGVWSPCTSSQALWVDADEDGVKAAEGEGMKAMLVENGTDALSKLASLAGLQVQTLETILLHFSLLLQHAASLALGIVCVCVCVFQGVDADSKPPSCKPNDVSHGYVTIRVKPRHPGYEQITKRDSYSCDANIATCVCQTGVRTHYVEMGEGPPVLLCHGFPESWYSWRYQVSPDKTSTLKRKLTASSSG